MARLIEPGIQPGARLRTLRKASAASRYSNRSMWPSPWKCADMTSARSAAGISFLRGSGGGCREAISFPAGAGVAVGSGSCVWHADRNKSPSVQTNASPQRAQSRNRIVLLPRGNDQWWINDDLGTRPLQSNQYRMIRLSTNAFVREQHGHQARSTGRKMGRV